jgi:hypothetical protein
MLRKFMLILLSSKSHYPSREALVWRYSCFARILRSGQARACVFISE